MTNKEKLEYLNLLISGTITHQMIADEYGCTRQYISGVLSGTENLSDETYKRILEALKRVIEKQREELHKKSIGL